MSTTVVAGPHPVVESVRDASAALAKAVDLPVWSLDDAAVVGGLDEAYALVAQANAVALRLLAEADRRNVAAATGAPSTRAWLRHRQPMSPGQAKREVALAGALEHGLAGTGQALAAGRISAEQAAAIAHVIGQAPGSAGPAQRQAAEQLLLDKSGQLDAVDLRRAGIYLWAVLDPEAAEAEEGRRLAAQEARAFDRCRLVQPPGGDGRMWLSGDLDNEAAGLVRTPLDPLAKPRPRDATGPDTRSGAQRYADALVELCRQALDSARLPQARGHKPHLAITCNLEALRAGLGTAMLDTGQPLSITAIRRLACDAELIPAVLDTSGMPLDVGRRMRLVPPSMRRALILRDGGCAFPGCTRPPAWCHVLPYLHASSHLRPTVPRRPSRRAGRRPPAPGLRATMRRAGLAGRPHDHRERHQRHYG